MHTWKTRLTIRLIVADRQTCWTPQAGGLHRPVRQRTTVHQPLPYHSCYSEKWVIYTSLGCKSFTTRRRLMPLTLAVFYTHAHVCTHTLFYFVSVQSIKGSTTGFSDNIQPNVWLHMYTWLQTRSLLPNAQTRINTQKTFLHFRNHSEVMCSPPHLAAQLKDTANYR